MAKASSKLLKLQLETIEAGFMLVFVKEVDAPESCVDMLNIQN